MLKGGCLPGCSAAKAGSSVGSLISGAASVSGTMSVPGFIEREEGEETDKYIANICNTEQAMLTCSAGLPKSMSRSLKLF
jgi:hypothetical protein